MRKEEEMDPAAWGGRIRAETNSTKREELQRLLTAMTNGVPK
jgi:hypothetical protein